MTFSTPEPVASGMPYVVVDVAGGPPAGVEQFAEADTIFTVDRAGTPYQVRGGGFEDQDGVRFHEKDMDHGGKDIRVWQVSCDGEGRFTAAAVAAF